MFRRVTLIAILAIGVLPGQASRAPLGGRIFGRVVGSAGKPVPAIGLTLTSQFNGSQRAGFRPVKLSTRTTSDGLFQFEFLSPGKYKVCLDGSLEGGASNDYLNPCTWTPEATTANVVAGSQVQMSLALTQGATLRIRVEDPGKHLDAHAGKTKDADFDLGFLTAQNLYQSARLISKKADEQIYEIRLPVGVSHRLRASSKFFNVQDERGPQAAKDDGVELPVQASARASLALDPPVVVLRVTGVKPGKP